MAVLPDDIRNVSEKSLPEKVNIIYEYIKYIKEQLEFWATNRTKSVSSDIESLETSVETLQDRPYIIRSGDIYSSTGTKWQCRVWSDGTTECWLNYSKTITSWDTWGNIFRKSLEVFRFPFTFTEVPTVLASLRDGNSESGSTCWLDVTSPASTQWSASYGICRATKVDSITPTISLYVIGKTATD